jgi:hypothetical protein
MDRVYVAGSGGAPWAAELDRLLANGSFDATFATGSDGDVAPALVRFWP